MQSEKIFLIITAIVGLLFGGLLVQHAQYEHSYDSHVDNMVYRVILDGKIGGQTLEGPFSPTALAPLLQQQAANVLQVGRIFSSPAQWEAVVNNQTFSGESIFHVDASIVEMLDYKVLAGDVKSSLSAPGKIVISDAAARRYYGHEDALGKSIRLNGAANYEVGAIVSNDARRTNFNFDGLISLNELPFANVSNWVANTVTTYLSICEKCEDAGKAELENQINSLASSFIRDAVESRYGLSYEDFLKDNYFRYTLQGVHEIRTGRKYDRDYADTVDGRLVANAQLAGVLLIIFGMLVSSQFALRQTISRAREMAIRRMCGAELSHLYFILWKSLAIQYGAALVISWLMAILLFSSIQSYFQLQYSLSTIISLHNIYISVLIVFLVVSVVSWYSIHVTREASLVTSMHWRARPKSRVVRRAIVTALFVATPAIVIASSIVYQQAHYLESGSWHLGVDGRYVISNLGILGPNYRPFLNALQDESVVKDISIVSSIPSSVDASLEYSTNAEGVIKKERLRVIFADDNIVGSLGLEFASVLPEFTRPDGIHSYLLLNETAAKKYSDQPSSMLGKTLTGMSPFTNEQAKEYMVGGILRDFHYEALANEIAPLAVVVMKEPAFNYGIIHTASGIEREVIETLITEYYSEYAEPTSLSVEELDDVISYENIDSDRIVSMLTILTLISVLFGLLAQLAILSREIDSCKKEIAIRYALGGNVYNILWQTFSVDASLYGIGGLSGVMIGSYYSLMWLDQYPYTNVSLSGTVLLAVLSCALIVLIAVRVAVLRASSVSVTDQLRQSD